MAGTATWGLTDERRRLPTRLFDYLGRRTALELAILDALLVAAGLLAAAPRAVAGDQAGLFALLALSPGLLFVGRSLVIAVHVPGVFRLAQLDPAASPASSPLLDEARGQAWLGMLLLAVPAAMVAVVGLG